MYKNIEIETSYRYLKKVISKMNEPICILGGWAVFFIVESSYKKQTGRIYIGSKDIDIGFNNADSFKEAALILENEMNFRFVSFRYYKNVHAETGKDLTDDETRKMPQHMFFQVYVDPIMPCADAETKIGFTPIDEPLLKQAFENKENRKEIREFGKKLLLPTPELLLATKLNSILSRDKEHKMQKDICDIVALCLFSGIPLNNIIKKAKGFISKETIKKFRNMNFEHEMVNCSNTLALELDIVKSIIGKIKER